MIAVERLHSRTGPPPSYACRRVVPAGPARQTEHRTIGVCGAAGNFGQSTARRLRVPGHRWRLPGCARSHGMLRARTAQTAPGLGDSSRCLRYAQRHRGVTHGQSAVQAFVLRASLPNRLRRLHHHGRPGGAGPQGRRFLAHLRVGSHGDWPGRHRCGPVLPGSYNRCDVQQVSYASESSVQKRRSATDALNRPLPRTMCVPLRRPERLGPLKTCVRCRCLSKRKADGTLTERETATVKRRVLGNDTSA